MINNPYPKQEGFSKRVNYAMKRLTSYCDAYDGGHKVCTRGFDSCFENYDGDAVVWEIMRRATQEILTRRISGVFWIGADDGKYHARHDCPDLLKGIINNTFMSGWIKFYGKSNPLDVEMFHRLAFKREEVGAAGCTNGTALG